MKKIIKKVFIFLEFFALYLFYNSFAKILFSKLTYFEIKTIKK